MTHEDISLLQRLAEEELRLAQLAETEEDVKAHYLHAACYLDLVGSSELAPPKPPPFFGRKG